MRLFRACSLAFLLTVATPLCVFAIQPSHEQAQPPSDTGWIRLFDGKSLNGWYTCLQNKKKNEDPAKIFQVDDGLIHVYKDQAEGVAVPNGFLATESEYSYFHLRFEYKWGDKRFKPRVAARRDAGVLYHVLPPDVVWPRCVECQIQENDVGDCFTVRGSQFVTTVDPSSLSKKPFRYKPEADGGVRQTVGDGGIVRVIKSGTYEHEGWNTVELMVHGSKESAHIVNGHTVFQARDLRQLIATPSPSLPPPAEKKEGQDNKKWEPLTHGHIAFQSEYAEVFYRNIEIRPIPEGPLHAAAAMPHVGDSLEIVNVAGR